MSDSGLTLLDLAQRAGVWLESVELYRQRGLLPPPDASGRYGERHLRIVRFIMRAQAELQLPLDEIAQVLVEDAHYDVDTTERLLVDRSAPDPAQAAPGPPSRAALVEEIPIAEALVDALVRVEALPSDGPYAGHHAWIAEATVELHGLGFGLDDVLRVVDLGREAAIAEVDAVITDVGRTSAHGTGATSDTVRRASVGQLLSSARQVAADALVSRLARVSNESHRLAIESLHLPSPRFIVRHRLTESLERKSRLAAPALAALSGPRLVGKSASSELPAGDPLLDYGRLLIGLGRLTEAVRILRVASAHPDFRDHALLNAYLGLALGLTEHEGAVARVALAQTLAPDDALVQALAAATLGVEAGRAPDLLSAMSRVQDALGAVERSRRCTTKTVVEDLETRLTRGRLCTVLPLAFGVREPGLDDLRIVVGATESASDQEIGFDVPGSRELVRINALFFLGMALTDEGPNSEGARVLEQVIGLDPASGFAARAYQRLGGAAGAG